MAGSASKVTVMVWILFVFAALAFEEFQDVVLSWNVTDFHSWTVFTFDKDLFTEFYHCLCDLNTPICEIKRDVSGWFSPIYLENPFPGQMQWNEYSNKYLCERRYSANIGYFFLNCEKLQSSQSSCSSTENCWSLRSTDQEDSCFHNIVEILWNRSQHMEELFRDKDDVGSRLCQTGCGVFTLTPTSTVTTTTTTSAKSTDIPSDNQTYAAMGNEDEGDNTSAVIIGLAVSLTVLVIALVVLGVLFWKRRRQELIDTLPGTNLNEPSPTDTVYTVSLHDINGTKPSHNAISTSRNESSCTYATVDLTKKAKSNGVVNAGTTDQPGYHSQDALEENLQSSNVNIDNSLGEQEGPYYNILHSCQNGTSAVFRIDGSSSANNITDVQNPGHKCPITDNTISNVDATYEGTNKGKVSPGPDHSVNQHTLANTDSADVSHVMSESDTGNEYSTLHEPIRDIKDPYNVLSP